MGELLIAEPAPATVLRTRLLSMPKVSREKLQQEILQQLTTVNQSLTDHALKRLDGTMMPPTVANWISDFGDMEKLQWQAKSPAWQGLEASDQQLVGKLFDLMTLLRHMELPVKQTRPQPAEPTEPFIPSIQQVAATTGVDLSSPIVHNRFSTVIKSGIKGIRSTGQLSEILARPLDQGGLGFDQMTVQKVLSAVSVMAGQYIRGEITLTEQKLKAPEEQGMPAPVMPDVAPEPVIAAVPQPIPVPRPISPRPMPPQPPTTFAPIRRAPQPRRSLVHDIKQPRSKLVGPIEELHRMDLESFRRLGTDAVAMVQKIKEKIDLLASESLVQKAEGVKAWKRSPVNQLYLSIGASSMALSKSIEAVIKDRQAGNEPALTPVEFRAIADLNKALRF